MSKVEADIKKVDIALHEALSSKKCALPPFSFSALPQPREPAARRTLAAQGNAGCAEAADGGGRSGAGG